MADLDYLTIGLVTDMQTERLNDDYDYDSDDEVREANQSDFDRF